MHSKITQNPLIQHLNTINSYLHLQEKNSKPISFNQIQTKYYQKKKKTYNVDINGGRQKEGRGE